MWCEASQRNRTSGLAAGAVAGEGWGGRISRTGDVSVLAISPVRVELPLERDSAGLIIPQRAAQEVPNCASKGSVDMKNQKNNTQSAWKWSWNSSDWPRKAVWEWWVRWAWKPWAKPLPAWTSLAAIVTIGLLAVVK